MLRSKYVQKMILAGIIEFEDTGKDDILSDLGFERVFIYDKILFKSDNLGIFLKLACLVGNGFTTYYTKPVPVEFRIPSIILKSNNFLGLTEAWVIQDIVQSDNYSKAQAFKYFTENGWNNLADIKPDNVCLYHNVPMFLDW